MRFRILCIYAILISIVYPRVCFAQEVDTKSYFDFELSQNLLKDGQEVQSKFLWNIKDFEMAGQKRLTVKPFISGGAVEIFNEDLNRYIGVADFNSTLPYLRQEMAIKFSGVQSSQNPLSLNFVIYDTLTGKNYSTPSKKVWGTAYYKKYTELLNDSILKEPAEVGAIQERAVVPVSSGVDKSQDPVKLYLWYLSPAFFLYGLVKSPNGFG